MTTPHKIAALATWAAEEYNDPDCFPLAVVGCWCDDLGVISQAVRLLNVTVESGALRPGAKQSIANRLTFIAAQAHALLVHIGVVNPVQAIVAEYERACVKNPGTTLDTDSLADDLRFYALAVAVGEASAAFTYDYAKETGYGADTVAKVAQVGALALTWLTRSQDGGER